MKRIAASAATGHINPGKVAHSLHHPSGPDSGVLPNLNLITLESKWYLVYGISPCNSLIKKENSMARNPVQFQKGISLNEFLSLYGTEQQCFDALYHWRWPNGFVCPTVATTEAAS